MNKIGSLAGIDPSAVACNDFLTQARDDLFREFPWPFATAQQALQQSAVSVPLGWTFCYDYPTTNVAMVWAVFNEATATKKDQQNFEVLFDPESGTKVIGSNLEAAYAQITYIVEDSLVWDAKFDLMFSFKLAALICPVLTGDADKALKLMDLYNGLLQETKRIAANEKIRIPDRSSGYVDAR